MNKLLAIIKREYVQRVRSRFFLLATVLGPVVMFGFVFVPTLIFSYNAGGPLRLAIVDETGRMYERVRDALSRRALDEAEPQQNANEMVGSMSNRNPQARVQPRALMAQREYAIVQVASAGGRSPEALRQELNERVKRNELDAYLLLPRDLLDTGQAELYTRNLGDEDLTRQITDRLTDASNEQRLIDHGIDPQLVRAAARRVELRTRKAGAGGAAADSSKIFGLAFGIGFFIYITILLYGQVVLGAVVEEKATRLTEMLFSSVDTFKLMIGKLLGVSLVALTQFTIWALAFFALTLYGANAFAASDVHLPSVPVSVIIYAVLFFFLGYFLYATIYLLLGTMVTTTQEGGQLAIPVVFMLVASLYLAVPVIRSPTSTFAKVISLVPFAAPITMMARIVAEPPPAWQIALSLLIGCATVVLLIWLAARAYRIGMLMYGKRASIPEMLRWIRQQ